ncbi:MAG TPA: CARDB domain-containing protein, partial [Pirellulaceae bacterium]|nr:CARDB domain-containing protein [Pirellulaceae bacterium]
YVDLVVDQLALTSQAAPQPGEAVTATWRTRNLGTRALTSGWRERLQLLNSDTGAILLTIDLDNDGELAAGGERGQTRSFVWPTGTASAGNFALRVVTDVDARVTEANPGGDAENNNSADLRRTTGPDLRVGNLLVDPADAAAAQAGSTLHLSWDDWNDGLSAIDATYYDRVTVWQVDSGRIVVDTAVACSPSTTGEDLAGRILRPGEYRKRRFDLHLPDGRDGSGRLEIRITADQDEHGNGAWFESNATSDAETNNSATVAVVSASKPYADLQVDSFSAPDSAIGAMPLTLSWTVANHGGTATAGEWNDQIVYSTDTVFGNADDVVLATVRHIGALGVGESYR